MAVFYNSIEEFATMLYTVHPKLVEGLSEEQAAKRITYVKSPFYGKVTSEVTEVKLIEEDKSNAKYQLKAIIRCQQDGMEPTEEVQTIKFKIFRLGETTIRKASLNVAIITPSIHLYPDAKGNVKRASFLGPYIDLIEERVLLGAYPYTLYNFQKIRECLKNNDFKGACLYGSKEDVERVRDFRLNPKVTKKMELIFNIDRVMPELTNDHTWKLMYDIANGVYSYQEVEEVTPYDTTMFDYRTGILRYLEERMNPTSKDSKGMSLKARVYQQLGQNAKIYPTVIEQAANNYVRTNNTTINLIQEAMDTSPLSIVSQNNTIKFMARDKEKKLKEVRVNSRYFDGILDPIRTLENTGKCNITQELSLAARYTKEGAFVKVYDKHFNEVELPMETYLNSRILSFECIDYKTKTVQKNRNGVYKYVQKARYHSTDNLNDIDYYRTETSLLSASASIMPMLNRNDVTRNLLQSHYNDQVIPCNGSRKPIIYTPFNQEVYRLSTTHVRSKSDGVVTGISPNQDCIKIKLKNGKEQYISATPDDRDDTKYISTKRHTSNIYVPNVKVGDKVKQGDVVFQLNSFKGKDLALGIPLLTTYSTLRGLEVEDGYAISESAAKKMMHPEVLKHRIILFKDKYKILNMTHCSIGDTFEPGEEFFTYYEDMLNEDNIDVFVGKYDKFRERTAKIPHYLMNAKITDIQIAFNPVLVNSHHPYYKMMDSWRSEILAEKRKFLKNAIYSDKFPSDTMYQTADFIIDIYIEGLNKFKLSDKMTNRSSNKGVVVAIVPDNEMPRTMDGRIIEVVMPALAMASRKNSFNITECKLTKLSKRLLEIMRQGKIETVKPVLDILYREIPPKDRYNPEYYFKNYEDDGFLRIMIDPFDSSLSKDGKDPDAVLDQLMEIAGIPDGGKEKLIDGKTGRVIKLPLLVGWNEYFRTHFLSEQKFTATPDISYVKECVMGLGKHRQEGQKIGEQETHALLASGKSDFLLRRNAEGEKKFLLEADMNSILLRLKPVVNSSRDVNNP